MDETLLFSPEPTSKALFRLAEQALADGAQALMILAADGNRYDPVELSSWLQALPVPVCGGIFPQIVFGRMHHETGCIVHGLKGPVRIIETSGLSSSQADYSAELESALQDLPSPQTVFIVVDGLAQRIAAFLDGVYDMLGSDPVYFGGGAGSLDFQQRPCIFSNKGLLVDHAQMVLIDRPTRVGVRHGWQKHAGPFVVTQAERNRIISLDYQPAFELYRTLVDADCGDSINSENFFEIAKGYPFGMERAGGEVVVRDPITVVDGTLVCVGEVGPNSIVFLLKGQPEALIAAAESAALAVKDAGDAPVIMIDCISRVLFLEARFEEELATVAAQLDGRALFGALTLGEIANRGDGCLEFFNKTMVLAGS